ncbi:MAG: LON peptidase substrate-binding domain-containing protein [Planctomycetes bacterium]|nr:LON peptidase substrate-binding domain-containing protein [Planctomycetota bacterium]
MVPIPDAWPPDLAQPDSDALPSAPVFPLPGVFLFPGQLMPLHVFEPRYRQMIEDSLDGPGRLVIGTVLERDRTELPGAPPILPTAGVGEIARHEKLPDGRFVLWLCGLARAHVEEIPSERLYRRVRYRVLRDVAPTDAELSALRPSLVDAIHDRVGARFEPDERMPLGTLADLLTQCVRAPEPVLVDLHGELRVAERARKALAAHERFPARHPSD